MRNSNRFLTTLIAVLAIVATLCMSASAATKFTDVKDSDEKLSEAVSLLSDLGVAKGTSDTTFGTDEKVTRQQMAAFIYRLVKSGKSLEGGDNLTTFLDLTDPTYFAYVSWANSMGVITGRSQTVFDPTGPIVLQDAYTMLVRALGYETKDEPLEYPFDHIDIAESAELDLDEGLSSSVGYTTALTRGDVAILLYNTFFAETNYATTEYVERLLAEGTDAETMVMEERTTYPTVAEYYYDVIEGDFTVVATPHYSFNKLGQDSNKPLMEDFDKDTLHLVASKNETIVGKTTVEEIFADFSELNLDGTANEYIMAGLTVFYTVDDEGLVDTIVYADGAVKKVTNRNATLGKVTVKNNKDYYTNGSGVPQTAYPKLDGSLKVGAETVYFFDAPYMYASPSYGNATDPDVLYALRNEKNIKLIEYRLIDEEKGTYGYYEVETPVTDADLVIELNQIYTGGLFEVDIYDTDSDGIYNYMRYKPATFGQAIDEEGKDFVDFEEHKNNAPVQRSNKDTNPLASGKIPTIYTRDADIRGADFNDEDYILAYLNTDANEILVFDVATKTKGTISYINPSTCTVRVNGKEFRLPYGYLIVENFEADGEKDTESAIINSSSAKTNSFLKLKSSTAFAEDIIVYSYNKIYNNLMFYEPVSKGGAAYDAENLLIPLTDASGNLYTTVEYDAKLSEKVYYIKAWVNGSVKYIPVDVEDTYPEPDYDENGYDFGITVTEDDGKEYFAYANKLCTYEIDSDGIYHLVSLFHARDDEGNFDGINNDATTLVEDDNIEQFGRDVDTVDNAERLTIEKVTGNRYKLVDENGETMLGNDTEQYIDYFTFTSATRILIKNTINAGTEDEESEYLTFDINTFGGTLDEGVLLENVQYILQGDPDATTRADMLFLYAEAKDFEFETKTVSSDWRVIKDSYVSADGKYYRNYYDLYNLATGKVDENVPGSKRASSADSLETPFENMSGKLVKLNTNGQVDENKDEFVQFDLETNDGLAFINEYIPGDSVIELTPVTDDHEYIEDSLTESYIYEVTDDTVVTVITLDKANSFDDAKIALAAIEDLEKPAKDILCYNDKYLEEDATKYSTEYYEFVKAYVYSSDEADELDDGEHPVADFIVVFVHPDYENDEYLDLK